VRTASTHPSTTSISEPPIAAVELLRKLQTPIAEPFILDSRSNLSGDYIKVVQDGNASIHVVNGLRPIDSHSSTENVMHESILVGTTVYARASLDIDTGVPDGVWFPYEDLAAAYRSHGGFSKDEYPLPGAFFSSFPHRQPALQPYQARTPLTQITHRTGHVLMKSCYEIPVVEKVNRTTWSLLCNSNSTESRLMLYVVFDERGRIIEITDDLDPTSADNRLVISYGSTLTIEAPDTSAFRRQQDQVLAEIPQRVERYLRLYRTNGR